MAEKLCIYLSAPSESLGQYNFNHELAGFLEFHGMSVVLSQDLSLLELFHEGADTITPKMFDEAHWEQASSANLVVAVLDDPMAIDCPTIMKCFQKKIPIVTLQTVWQYHGDSNDVKLVLDHSQAILPYHGKSMRDLAENLHNLIMKVIGAVGPDLHCGKPRFGEAFLFLYTKHLLS